MAPFDISFFTCPLTIFQGFIACLITKSCGFAQPAAMGGTGIVLLSQSTIDYAFEHGV